MSEQYYEEETIDLKELILTYLKKWKLIGLISVITAIIVFVGIKVVINRNAFHYSIEFEFTYPGYETGLYPNGKQFRYQDIVSTEFVIKAIESDSAFSDFSASDIVSGKLISVEQKKRTVVDENKNETDVVEPGMYIFNMNARYFKSSSTAEAFLDALLDVVAESVKESAETVDYKFNLVSYEKADTYANKIAYLSAQKSYINSIYSSWISEYGDQYTVKGVSINRYRENASFAFTSKVYDELVNELQRRQYVYNKGTNEKLACELQIEILNEQIEDIDKKIAGLTAALEELRKGDTSTGTASVVDKTNETQYYTEIADLTEQKVDIERQISRVQIQIDNLDLDKESQEFLAKLDAVRDALLAETEILEKTVAPAVYEDKTVAELEPVGFTVTGGTNAILYSGIAFVGMYFVVGFFCFLLRDEEAEDKKKKVKTA